MEPGENSETGKEVLVAPVVIISSDIPSFPTKYRLKKPLSRLSLATDRFSCVSFLTSSQRSDLSCCGLPRSRSLPTNLQDEELFNDWEDGVDLVKTWSKYRITNMGRRYKTMDYINVMVEDSQVMYNGDITCDLSTIVGLSVSRDFLDCRLDSSDAGSGIVPHSASDEQLHFSASEFDAAKQHLTEANVNFVLASSRTCSCEHLDSDHRNAHKIEKWLQRCYFQPSEEELGPQRDSS